MLLLLSSSGPGDSGSVFLSGSVPHDQGVGGEVQGGRLQRAHLHQGKKVPSPQHNTTPQTQEPVSVEAQPGLRVFTRWK